MYKFSCEHIIDLYIYCIGTVPVISPHGTALVCSGDQLELTCAVTGAFLEWNIFLIPENSTTPVNRGGHLLNNQLDQMPVQLVINSVFFNFSVVSPPNTLPLVSRLLISPASSSINGTEVICTDSTTSTSLSSMIYIIDGHLIQGGYSSLMYT